MLNMLACVLGHNSKDIRMLCAYLARLWFSKSTNLMAKTLANHGLMAQGHALSKDTRCPVVMFRTILNVTSGNRS